MNSVQLYTDARQSIMRACRYGSQIFRVALTAQLVLLLIPMTAWPAGEQQSNFKNSPLTYNTRDDIPAAQLQQHFEDFPLLSNGIKHTRPLLRDEYFMPQDGSLGSDTWRRLILNQKPVIIDGKRYDGFRIKADTKRLKNFYWAFREWHGNYSWQIITAKGKLPEDELHARVFARRDDPVAQAKADRFWIELYDGGHFNDGDTFLVCFNFGDEKPQELAFRFIFSDFEWEKIAGMGPPGSITIDTYVSAVVAVLDFDAADKVMTELPKERPSFGIIYAGQNEHEPRILGIVPGSPADKAGLEVGDVVLKINDQTIGRINYGLEDFEDDATSVDFTFVVQRKGQEEPITAQLKLEPVSIPALYALRDKVGEHDRPELPKPPPDYRQHAEVQKIRDDALALLKQDPLPQEDAVKARQMLDSVRLRPLKDVHLTLSKMYLEGIGGPADPTHAFRILDEHVKETVIHRVSVEEALQYAWHLQEGVGTAINREKAAKAYEAVSYQSAYGGYMAGLYYLENAESITRGYGRAKDLFLRAYHKDHLESGYQAGLITLKTGAHYEQDNAYKHLTEVARKGHPKAMVVIGYMLAEGRGVDKDDTLAVQWFTKAWYEHKEPYAAYALAKMMQQGRGITTDWDAARELMLNAAQEGVIAPLEIPPAKPRPERRRPRPRQPSPGQQGRQR